MVDNIFDDIDISEIVQADVPAVEAIPMLPTVERYDYVFTAWLKSGWSFADYSSMDDSLELWNHMSILKKLGLINDFSPVTVWRINNEGLTQFAVDAHEIHTIPKIIRSNDTKPHKNKVSIGVSGRLDGVLLLNIMLCLLEFVEQHDMRSVMIDVSTGSPFNKPTLYKYGYSILEHFHRKQNSGPDIAAAFREFIHLYQQSIVPQLISKTEYERIKTMFRLHNNQDVNLQFKSIFYRIDADSYKTLSRQMEKGVIGKNITQGTLLTLLKNKKSLPRHICIELFLPWKDDSDDVRWYLDTYNKNMYDFVGGGLRVRDVRLNSRKTRYNQEFCVAIYCGVRNVPELREVFVVIESYDFKAVKSTLKLMFPGVETSCLKGILNVED